MISTSPFSGQRPENKTPASSNGFVALVELVAVAMALEDRRRAVRAARLRGRHERALSYAPSRIVAPLSTIERCSEGGRSRAPHTPAGTRRNPLRQGQAHCARTPWRPPGDRGRCRDTALRARVQTSPPGACRRSRATRIRGHEGCRPRWRAGPPRRPAESSPSPPTRCRPSRRARRPRAAATPRRTCTRPSGPRTSRTARSAPSATRRVAAQERLPIAEVDLVVREAQLSPTILWRPAFFRFSGTFVDARRRARGSPRASRTLQ